MQCSAPLVGIDIPSFRKDKFGSLKLRSNTVLSRQAFLSSYRFLGHEKFSETTGFLSSREDRGIDIFAGSLRTVTDSKGTVDSIFDAKYSFLNPSTGEYVYPYPVPCGTCINCRLRRAATWADRMVMEQKTSDRPCWFITLTYDDAHVPWSDNDTALTLNPLDLDRFRKNFEMYCFRHKIKPRHYLAGEYGSKTFRPHYHGILFNFDIPDLKLVGNNFRGDAFYQSDLINGWWKKGFVCIAECSWETCAYTARYVLKKKYGKQSDFYDEAGIFPEFQRQSNRPGIGFDYYKANRDKIFSECSIVLPNGHVASVPQYFERLYEDEICDLNDVDLAEAYQAYKIKKAQRARDAFSDKMHVLQVSEEEYFSGIKLRSKQISNKLIRSLDQIQ